VHFAYCKTLSEEDIGLLKHTVSLSLESKKTINLNLSNLHAFSYYCRVCGRYYSAPDYYNNVGCECDKHGGVQEPKETHRIPILIAMGREVGYDSVTGVPLEGSSRQ
jgi:hypothetical protein